MLALALTAALVSAPVPASGVKSANSQGFEVTQEFESSATPSVLYDALTHPSQWWNGAHTYSRSGTNMSLDARIGGCLCEKLANGGAVQHMTIVAIEPGRFVRLSGALGPLANEGVNGFWAITIEPMPGGSAVHGSYVVGGYFRPGASSSSTAEELAPAVSRVLTDQLERLKRFVETGSPT